MANQAAAKRLEEECEYWSVLSTFCIIQEALPTSLVNYCAAQTVLGVNLSRVHVF